MNQGESSAGPSVQLAKRSRGRPRKDPSLKHVERAHKPPGYGRAKPYLPQRADSTLGIDPRVGQAVSGVVEGSFDAGYLINVKFPDSNTSFRGVVFKPGQFVPVTAANDVAPDAQMIRRNDVPFPAENQNWSQGEKLSMQTVPLKRKYASKTTTPPVHPVGERGTVVPVVLQPVTVANGLQQASDDGDKDVHMVEPLSMLPPVSSKPVSQIFVGAQPQGRVQDNSCSFNEGTSEGGQGEKGKTTTSTDIDTSGSSHTSDMIIENGKEELKSAEEDSGIGWKQGIVNSDQPNQPFAPTITKPIFNCGTGRMTELLQALQENMKDGQVQIADRPNSASKVEFHQTMTTETDSKDKANVL